MIKKVKYTKLYLIDDSELSDDEVIKLCDQKLIKDLDRGVEIFDVEVETVKKRDRDIKRK